MPVLQVSFTYSVPEEQFAADNGPDAARAVAQMPGLEWKLWLHDPSERTCVGVYCFTTAAQATAYADGPFLAGLRALPGYGDVRTQLFDVMTENSVITRAPGLVGVAA